MLYNLWWMKKAGTQKVMQQTSRLPGHKGGTRGKANKGSLRVSASPFLETSWANLYSKRWKADSC
eukprot:12936502-Prorocentrum_lima.AAC.1